MLKQTKNNAYGFTLIEAMVVIAIVSIMTGAVIASLGNGRVKRELETNAREFASVIREAQNNALTGKSAIAGTTPCGYQINWTAGSSYAMTYLYKSGAACDQSSPVASYVLKNGVSFSASGFFGFSLPHADLSGSSSAVLGKRSDSHAVCVYADGRILNQSGSSCP